MGPRVIADDDADGKRLDEWLNSIGDAAKEVCQNVAEDVAGTALEASISELKVLHEERTDTGPGTQEVHPPLFTDVIKKHRKKDGYYRISGGKRTGKLWHIVNDGTYRTRPRRFMQNVMQKVDDSISSAWDKQRGKL